MKNVKPFVMCDWVREVEHASYSVQYAGPELERSALLSPAEREPVLVRVFWVVFLTILLGLGIAIGCYLMIQEDRTWPVQFPYIIMDRAGWRAAAPLGAIAEYSAPATLVLITHSCTSACGATDECAVLLRRIQTDHMENHNMSDIAYNFLVAGDGTTYEGRGWTHQPGAGSEPNRTLLVAFIGTFTSTPLSDDQYEEFSTLLAEGIHKDAVDECCTLVLDKDIPEAKQLRSAFNKFLAENEERKASLNCTSDIYENL